MFISCTICYEINKAKVNRQCDITLEEHLFTNLFLSIFVPPFARASLELGPQKDTYNLILSNRPNLYFSSSVHCLDEVIFIGLLAVYCTMHYYSDIFLTTNKWDIYENVYTALFDSFQTFTLQLR